jgi:hypothetical protein
MFALFSITKREANTTKKAISLIDIMGDLKKVKFIQDRFTAQNLSILRGYYFCSYSRCIH